MKKISIALINQQPIVLDGLYAIFAANVNFTVIAKSRSTCDIVTMASQCNPDVLILDLDDSGQAIKAISEISRRKLTRIVVFTPATSIESAVQALDAGAAAYVSTNSMADELVAAVQAVSRGETFISPSVASKVIAALRVAARRRAAVRAKGLSVREDQIVCLLLKGKTNKEIAAHLGLSEKTIKHYMGLLMQKLDARNRLEVALALKTIDPAASLSGSSLFN